MKKLLKNRFLYICLGVIFCMSLICIKLYSLQIIHGDDYDAIVSTKNQATIALEARRGDIYDRNGVKLAGSRVTYKLQMTYVNSPQEERDAMYLELLNLLETNGDRYINLLAPYINEALQWGTQLDGDENSSKRSAWISTVVSKKEDKEKIKTAKDAFDYLKTELFGIDEKYSDEEAYKIMAIRYATRTQGLSTLYPMTVAEDISEETMMAIETGYLNYPGVYTDLSYKRVYYYPELTSHIIGYIRGIDETEYNQLKDRGYKENDLIGKTGIEQACEADLRGTEGYRKVYYDSEAGIVRTAEVVEAIPGKDIYLTIDINYQKTAYDALVAQIENTVKTKDDKAMNFGDANAGTVVMEDARNGAVLAMVSYPAYDNNLFIASSDDKEAQAAISAIFTDPASPSLNRATQGLYPVGSTFKAVSAIAALESGKISGRWQQETCTGKLILEGMEHDCQGNHGVISMDTAFTMSCNSYFQQITLVEGVGVDNIDRYAKMLGLGERTGIEIGEYAGYRSNRDTMAIKETDKTHVWGMSDTAQTAIGQLYTQFTPLQLCNYAAALGNGGYRNQPTLILKSVAADGEEKVNNSNNRVKLDINSETLDIVKAGMKAVVDTKSTSANVAFANFEHGFVAAKTGTAQTGLEALGQSSHSAVICYAPAKNPEVAVSVFVEHGAWGRYSLPTAAKVMEDYFNIEPLPTPTPAPIATPGVSLEPVVTPAP
ncbi:MAG: hypothetical protein E7388_07165 [Ruminococcaceae bacterium]|nr:hypothetical protein [Oscillospiraceae bacterium]